MEGKLARYAPLTGALFVVLVTVGFLVSGSTPEPDAEGSEVIDFYKDGEAKQFVAILLVILGSLALVWWASTLRSRLRDAEGGAGRLANVAFAGGVGSAVGFWLAAALHLTLIDIGSEVDESSARVLNALDGYTFVVFTPGIALMVLATAFIAHRTHILPAWMAWAGFVLFVAFFTPVGFFAFLLSGIWTIIVSVLFYQRQPAASSVQFALA